MDEIGADLVLAASQKGLMLPPGMGFVAVGERARRAAERGGMPRRYWDWDVRRGELAYMWFCGTPPVSMLFGLRESLDMLLEEGLPAVFARHRRLAEAVRRAVARWAGAGALDFYARDEAARSDAVTALELAEGGVTCNAVCPGYVWTPLVEKQIDDQARSHGLPRERVVREVLLAPQPNKRFATVEEMGALVAFLCSEAAASITGAAIPVDGGWTAH
jgi:hypothetical protein